VIQIKRLLVANRGEIARRVMRSASNRSASLLFINNILLLLILLILLIHYVYSSDDQLRGLAHGKN
jgi:biotin carboxylase